MLPILYILLRVCQVELTNSHILGKLVKMDFPNYLEQQFLAWQQRKGKRKTLDDFAYHLKISRPLLSMWLKGNRRPGSKKIEFLAELFGPEVYDALNLPRPNPDLQALIADWNYIPPEKQRILREQGKQYKIQNQNDEKSVD